MTTTKENLTMPLTTTQHLPVPTSPYADLIVAEVLGVGTIYRIWLVGLEAGATQRFTLHEVGANGSSRIILETEDAEGSSFVSAMFDVAVRVATELTVAHA